MRWKIVSAVVIGSCLLWILYNSSVLENHQQLAEELSRRQAGTISSEQTDRRSNSEMFRLSENLFAEREGNTWFVTNSDKSAFLAFPFMPPRNGEFDFDDRQESPAAPASSENPGFLGAQACGECHQEKHAGFVETGHHQTSRPANATDLPGSFLPPTNELRMPHSDLRFEIFRQDGWPRQRIHFDTWQMDIPMDVVTGSAKNGQSYLYWLGDELYQDHVSYLTSSNEWIASPGLEGQGGTYTRQIRAECLECHITYIEKKRPPNHFHRDSAIWGISCERCHGPGAKHVQYHRENPQQRVSKFIVYPKNLPRQRQLDICAQCHSGSFRIRSKAFAFRPGDDVNEHHRVHAVDPDAVGGVHTSNQLVRLRRSKCFQQSEMTCTSCHDPHQNQRGNSQLFSQRCLQCHPQEDCGLHDQLGETLANDCISCHMPSVKNEGMDLDLEGGEFTPPMVDHHIRVDRDATDIYLQSR